MIYTIINSDKKDLSAHTSKIENNNGYAISTPVKNAQKVFLFKLS